VPEGRVDGRRHIPDGGCHLRGPQQGGPAGLMRWSAVVGSWSPNAGHSFAFVTEEGGRESTEWRYDFEQVEGGTG